MKKISKTKIRKDIMNHLKMVSRLYSAGVPLMESFSVFCDDNKTNWKSEVVNKLRLGKTFSQSIEELDLPIRDYEITILRKSEESGNLSDGLNRVYMMNKNIEKTKSKFFMALLYPCIIIFVSFMLIIMILIIIVPKIKPLFNGGKVSIPWSTKVLFFLSSNLYLILIISIALIFFIYLTIIFLLRKGDSFRSYLSNAVVNIPIVGPLIRNYSFLISFRIASEVFASSGLLVESIRDSAMGSLIPRERFKLLNIANDVESGIALSKSLGKQLSKDHKLWIPLIICGEQTGSISETFSSIANIHQEYFDEGITLINKLIEPISMVLVGIGVGFIAVSIITPIYSLISYTGY